MALKVISIVLLAAAVAVHLIACSMKKLKLRMISKVLLVPLIVLLYISWAPSPDWPVIVGLFFGWLGDIFLIYSSNKILQLLGIVSFGVGHAFYVTAMHELFKPLAFYWYIIAVLIVAGAAAIALSRVARLIEKNMYVGAGLYYTMLSCIGFGSLVILFSGNIAGAFLLAGSWLFLGSDTHLVKEFYVAGGDDGMGAVAVMSSYIAAQILIVTGFLI